MLRSTENFKKPESNAWSEKRNKKNNVGYICDAEKCEIHIRVCGPKEIASVPKQVTAMFATRSLVVVVVWSFVTSGAASQPAHLLALLPAFFRRIVRFELDSISSNTAAFIVETKSSTTFWYEAVRYDVFENPSPNPIPCRVDSSIFKPSCVVACPVMCRLGRWGIMAFLHIVHVLINVQVPFHARELEVGAGLLLRPWTLRWAAESDTGARIRCRLCSPTK